MQSAELFADDVPAVPEVGYENGIGAGVRDGLSDHAAPVVVGVGGDDFGVGRRDHAVLVVPGVCEASVACHVAVGVVGEPLGRLRDEDAAGDGGDLVLAAGEMATTGKATNHPHFTPR